MYLGTNNLVPRSYSVTVTEMYTFNRLAVECLSKRLANEGIPSVHQDSFTLQFQLPVITNE